MQTSTGALKRFLAAGLATILSSWGTSAFAEFPLNMTEGVTPVAHTAYSVHMMMLWVCTVVGIIVFGAIFYSVIKFRKSNGAVASNFHESTTVEIIWTALPFLILVSVSIPAAKGLIAMEDVGDSEITIKATAYQWKWHYDYINDGVNEAQSDPDKRVRFFSNLDKEHNDARQVGSGVDPATLDNYLMEVDNEIVLPVGKKVRILTTAADVIHSWWVPDLGFKRDAIPGFINASWALIEKAGTYRGKCAELCGKDHGFMPIVVRAVEPAEYEAWLAGKLEVQAAAAASGDKEWSKDELMAKGEEVYTTSCAACHQPNGEGLPGVVPGLKGSAIAIGPIADHLKIVLHGKPGTAMAAYAAQLNDADLAAVITYERNTWGNDTGDIVQPTDVKAAR